MLVATSLSQPSSCDLFIWIDTFILIHAYKFCSSLAFSGGHIHRQIQYNYIRLAVVGNGNCRRWSTEDNNTFLIHVDVQSKLYWAAAVGRLGYMRIHTSYCIKNCFNVKRGLHSLPQWDGKTSEDFSSSITLLNELIRTKSPVMFFHPFVRKKTTHRSWCK